jgi:hypothetical protein
MRQSQVTMTTPYRVPPLVSGGVILSYHCTNRCRHCKYCCAPSWPNEWMTLEQAERIFTLLAGEPQLSGVHLAGGEAFLKPRLLTEVVRLAGKCRVPIDYVETNGFWARSERHARDLLQSLRAAGLHCLLISVSPFHTEFIPLEVTLRAIRLTEEIFGPGGAFVWQSHWIEILSRFPTDRTLPFDQLLAGIPRQQWPSLPAAYSLSPGGRVPWGLPQLYQHHTAAHYAGCRCQAPLLGTMHFHLDLEGNYMPQGCSGFTTADLEDLHAPADYARRPFLQHVYSGCLGDLLAWAQDTHGFQPDPIGYISSCHLCTAIRYHLFKQGDFPELRPRRFYSELSAQAS